MQTVSIILAIIFAAVSAGAEEIRIGEPVEVFTHNSVLKRHTKSILQVKYDTKANSYYLVTADSMTVSYVEFKPAQIKALSAALSKFTGWRLKAIKKGVTLEKEIAKISFSQALWKTGDSWSLAPGGAELRAVFFSQNKKDHQLVLVMPTVVDARNKYIKHTVDPLYLNLEGVQQLTERLKPEAVNSTIAKLEKQKQVESDFQ